MEFKYLAIKNWETFQTGKKGWDWIKDYVNQNDDADLSGLTLFERGLLQELRRLRGRSGKNIHNKVTHIAQAIHAKVTDRPHIGHAVITLISRGLLIPTNQQVNFVDERREDEKRGEEKEPEPQKTHPKKEPAEFTGDDLVFEVLRQMGVSARNPELTVVVSDALNIKAREPTWNIQLAARHFIERGKAYKASRAWNTQYKKSWVKWFQDQCYDQDPSAWEDEKLNGSTSKAADKINRNREAIVSGLTGQGDWSDAGHNQPNIQRSGVNAGTGVVLEGSTQRVKPATNT